MLELKTELEKLDRDWIREKQRHDSVPRLEHLQSMSLLVMVAGFTVVVLGLWLHDLGNDIRLERLLHPWPAICLVLGPCLVVGALVFVFGYVHPSLRAFYLAKSNYDDRREQLVDAIYGTHSPTQETTDDHAGD